MKSVFLLLSVALALGACANDPEPVWCTGEGTGALVRDTSKYSTEAWSLTRHPLCDGKPRGHVVLLEDPIYPTPTDFMIGERFVVQTESGVEMIYKWNGTEWVPEVGEVVEGQAREDASAQELTLEFLELEPLFESSFALNAEGWEIDKNHPGTFYLAGDDWILLDETGEPYLRCRFAGQLYRLYLVREPS